MDIEENQKQVSLGAHSPLEIVKGAIPTFPPPRRRGRMEKWKSKSRIPTFPPARVSIGNPKNKTKKGVLAADRFAPAFRLILCENQNRRSGSSFDENMLIHRPVTDPSISTRRRGLFGLKPTR